MGKNLQAVSTAGLAILFFAAAGQGAAGLTINSCNPPAQVETDQRDYLPGTTAYIAGCGFLAGETVELQVLHIDSTPSTGQQHDPWQVTADSSGNIESTWLVCR